MKKMILIAAMVMVILTGQSAIAEAGAILGAVGAAVAEGAVKTVLKGDVVGNVTTITKDGNIKGEDVDVGVVEMKGSNSKGVINITTVNGTVTADDEARVGFVVTENGGSGVINVTTVGGKVESTGGKASVGVVKTGQ